MADTTILAKRGSIGNFDNSRPDFVNWLLMLDSCLAFKTFLDLCFVSIAAISSSNLMPSVIFLLSGASTKGNVLLQFCGITRDEIPYIAEINEDKFGRVTPGTHIPIVSEEEAHNMQPDYFLVLPWHFKNSILKREIDYINKGGKFIFPLPYIEIL